MREERLLERLRAWKERSGRRAEEDSGKIVESVIRHLTRILNTRRGNVPIAEDYGVPDLTDFLSLPSESANEIERSLRQVIQRYEPRLKVQQVSFVPSEEGDLSLRFEIVSRLATSPKKGSVHFQTIVDANGKVSVVG
jgi:type VI secretion system protein